MYCCELLTISNVRGSTADVVSDVVWFQVIAYCKWLTMYACSATLFEGSATQPSYLATCCL